MLEHVRKRGTLNKALLLSLLSRRWLRTVAVPVRSKRVSKLRFDGWFIWGLSCQIHGFARPGPLALRSVTA